MPMHYRPKVKYSLPDTADGCREELEQLRGDRIRGLISSEEFVLRSARLVRRAEQLSRLTRRTALT